MIGITGVNGFVGSHLYKYLTKVLPGEVIGLSTNPNERYIIKLKDGIPQDNAPIKTLAHCGGVVGNGYLKADYLYANVECTKRLVGWCEKHQVQHFILFSTGSVYDKNIGWVDEESAINPIGYYAESKLLAENLLLQSSIPIKTIIRLYFPLGSLKYKHLFSKIAYNIRSNHEVVLNKDKGYPYISPVYIFDVCHVIENIICNKIDGIYNLSSNSKITIGEIIELISVTCNIKARVRITNDFVYNYLGNADKIVNITKYKKFISPLVALKSVLEEEIDGH